MRSRPRLLLDCDPGHDDVLAMLVALVHGQLDGVTVVAGNGSIGRVHENATTAALVFGYTGPIVPGADRPLAADRAEKRADFGLVIGPGAARRAPAGRVPGPPDAAACFLIDRATHGTWIIATGPLTNVATALRLDPALADRVEGISVMCGGSFGNVTPAAEFNAWSDPEALAAVLGSGARVRMCGLDVTHQVLVDEAFVTSVRATEARASGYVADVLGFFIDTYPDAFVGEPLGPLHDPCAVLAVTHPELLGFETLAVRVEVDDGARRGMTVFDGGGAAEVEFAKTVDAPGVLDAVLEAVVAVRR